MILFVLPFMFEQSSAQQNAFAGEHHAIVNYWLGNETPDVPNKCGLPAINYALRHRNELDASLQSALTQVLMRPTTQKSILVGNFRIHYDTTGEHEPAILDAQHNRIPGTANRYADSVGAIVNYALRFERDSLGFLPPPPDNGSGGGTEFDIYIQELGGSYYGFTNPETPIINRPDGGTFTTYITIDNDFNFVTPDSNKGLPGLRVTLAHELHHAVQIGNYAYWSNDVYFYEITSVWMEDAVFTGVNDYYQYLRSSQGHFRRPDVAFTSNGLIMYSRGIWGNFVAKRFGSQTMLRSWEYVRDYRPIEAIDNALRDVGSGFRQAFGEWSVWNYYTGERANPAKFYPEGSFYPLMIESAKGFSPPSRSFIDSLRSLSSRYYDIAGGQVPLKLITSNINIAAALSNNSLSFPFSYLLNTSRVDESYVPTASRIYVKFDVPDRLNWVNVIDTSDVNVLLPPPRETVFPNPFVAQGMTTIKIPIGNFGKTQGTLSVFSASMDLVFSASASSVYTTSIGQQVFEWNGRNNDQQLAASGIYFYVLELPTQTLTGKFALLRK